MQRKLALVCLLTLALSAGGFAADARLAADSYVASISPTTNFGTNGSLRIDTAGSLSFIQFDLSTLPAGTTGGGIAKATLRLYVNKLSVAGSMNLNRVTGSWSELSVTSATAPSI